MHIFLRLVWFRFSWIFRDIWNFSISLPVLTRLTWSLIPSTWVNPELDMWIESTWSEAPHQQIQCGMMEISNISATSNNFEQCYINSVLIRWTWILAPRWLSQRGIALCSVDSILHQFNCAEVESKPFSRGDRGLYFGPKTIFIPPPPSENDIFSPSRDTSFFDSHRGLFALHLAYFAFILSFYFPFSHFLSRFFLFLSSFFLFLLHIPLFSLRLFIFFPPNDIGWYFPKI